MDDLISRQAAIDIAKDLLIQTEEYHQYNQAVNNYCAELVKLPSIQPESHEGRWILYDKRFPWRTWYKCSECGNYLDFSGVNGGRGEVNYCPNCGAKMRGKQE